MESPAYMQSNRLIFLKIQQTFINKNSWLKKSVKICYAINWSTLDWTRYAIALEPGRAGRKEKWAVWPWLLLSSKGPTLLSIAYLVQSRLPFSRVHVSFFICFAYLVESRWLFTIFAFFYNCCMETLVCFCRNDLNWRDKTLIISLIIHIKAILIITKKSINGTGRHLLNWKK